MKNSRVFFFKVNKRLIKHGKNLETSGGKKENKRKKLEKKYQQKAAAKSKALLETGNTSKYRTW